jgi:DNA-binding response OmpR family regulator
LANSGRPDHVLVWMRDSSLADRLRRGLERNGFATTWAAALPEAVAAIDREFPCAIACTLVGRTPSLMDLETAHAYLALGHRFVSLPPVPVWALTPHAARYASELEVLGLPVHLVPHETGAEGLLGEVLSGLRPGGAAPAVAPAPAPVLLLLGSAGEAAFLSRYLRARHMDPRVPSGPEEALAWLESSTFGALVAEDLGDDAERGAFWARAEALPSLPPILLVASGQAWLRSAAPAALPRGIACTLRKPIRAHILEACLRRLLRIPAPAGQVPTRAAS